MDPRMANYIMRGDGRNPYGSKGGYVVPGRSDRRAAPSRADRNYSGMPDSRHRNIYDARYDMRYDGNYDGNSYFQGEFCGMSDSAYQYPYGNPMPDYAPPMPYHDHAPMPYMDYASGGLSRDELMHWKRKLCEEMDKGECEMLSDEKILKRAKEMGIHFDEFTEDELIVTTLMMYTDYCKTLGKTNIDMYIKLAKDFLDDKDARVKHGQKLAAYFDNIVNV